MYIRHDAVVSRNRSAGAMPAALLALSLLAAGLLPAGLEAQRVITQSTRTINVARGGSALVQTTDAIARISVADPEIADPVLISPREIMINARTVGTTTLLLWDRNERVEMMSIVVTPDIGALQRQIEILFPGTAVNLAASGNAVIVSGNVRDPHTARRLLEVVQTSGATVINNLAAPSARQILLHVRFAEVSRTVLNALGSDLRALIVGDLPNEIDLIDVQTLSEGAVSLFLLGDNGSAFEALIRALRTQGHFRSLAEPNLIALEGETATFLAGGEFPFPMVQGGQSNAITIQWKEFGVRLNFTPTITNIGTVRLHVAPEVSSLDFANGLTISGFQIPALLTRRAETFVELRPGQHLAIAGLLDNTKLTETTKIPILGDLPILGTFFRSTSTRDRNTELLVLVTPHLVEPTDVAPAMPTGETDTWDRNRFMRERNLHLPSGVRLVPPSQP
ncbi:MAG TPA: type II and III secretion system protein family protein [Longimicrobiales bacterium]|nr:type II and III secretion system protein family protein [Longimicrobiales bacterium]